MYAGNQDYVSKKLFPEKYMFLITLVLNVNVNRHRPAMRPHCSQHPLSIIPGSNSAGLPHLRAAANFAFWNWRLA